MSTVREATARKIAEGWASVTLERPAAETTEQWAAMFALAKLCADTFSTPSGQALLTWLVATFIARPTVHPNDTQFAAGIREGQADVVRQLLTNIEIARRGTPT